MGEKKANDVMREPKDNLQSRRMVTMRDIAEKANVSQTTVSFVLNKRRSVFISEETKVRVTDAARELGYRPNHMARALAMGRTESIGVWLKSLHSTYYLHLVNLLDQQVTDSGYTLTFARNATISATSSIMQVFPSMSVDGLIAIDIPETVDFFATHAFGATPIVSCGSHFTDRVDCVALEMTDAVAEAMAHLYETGRRRIALIIDQGSYSVGGGPRMQGYRKFVADAGLSEIIVVIEQQAYSYARLAVQEMFAAGVDGAPDALLCYNDDLAIGALRGLAELGISIPGQVAVVGCDDTDQASYQSPSLSSISHPHVEMSRIAWEFLHARILDQGTPIKFHPCKSRFIRRESS